MGGVVAAPIFKEIAEEALRYLHVPPTAAVVAEGKGPHPTGKDTPTKTAATEIEENAGGDAPATDLPLDDDALGEDPALAEKWDEVAGAEGGARPKQPSTGSTSPISPA